MSETIAQEPIDGGNPDFYSQKISVSPYSFVDHRQKFHDESPPPTYLPYETLDGELPTEYEDLFLDLTLNPSGGLICTNEEAMDKQKGIIKDVLTQLTKNFIKGLGISHMSLPVRMFEPKSMIQRIVDMFSFAPVFLKAAATMEDPLERFKRAIAFAVSGMHLCTGQVKPFNPILGETFEGFLGDDTKIFCEHISHHPPITNYSMEDVNDEYEFYGSAEFTASLGANNLKTQQIGNNYVIYKKYNHKIRLTGPKIILGGTVMGQRTMNLQDAFVFHDETYGFKAVIIYNPIIKSGGIFSSHTYAGVEDEFRGLIYYPD